MMRVAKEYLMFSFYLAVYIIAISVLVRQFYIYQKAYHSLSRLISHTTILTEKDEGGNAIEE